MKATRNREGQNDAMEQLLRQAIPPVGDPGDQPRNLWPAMQARLSERAGVTAQLKSVPWFDWALAAGVALFAVTVPAAVPVLLYYL